MKPRLVEVTLRFESDASMRDLRDKRTWSWQLLLVREFVLGHQSATIAEAGAIAMKSNLRTVRVVRAKRVKR